MTFDPKRHHRRSIRLRGYDYAQAGAYFITIVTQGRECLFGQVVNGEMRLNDLRDSASLNRIRQYIIANPAQWANDDENPLRGRR